MFGPEHYIPVLKWKQNEQLAVSDLSPRVKEHITPLIEFQPIPVDPRTDTPTKSIEKHTSDQARSIRSKWGAEQRCFVDVSELGDEVSEDGRIGPEVAYAAVRDAGVNFVPVIRLSHSAQELRAIKAFAEGGLCLRVKQADLEPSGLRSIFDDANVFTPIDHLLQRLGREPSEIDLMLDLGDITDRSARDTLRSSLSMMDNIPCLPEWRSFTLLACAFPESLSSIPPNNSGFVTRGEWQIWSALYEHRNKVERMPAFGDYGIQNPISADDVDFRRIPLYASIRYTAEDRWFIIRGESSRDADFRTQFPHLASLLTDHDVYYGAEHCEGCRIAEACAQGEESAASLGKWRRIGTCHHLTVVVDQLHQMRASSDIPSQPA